MTSQSKIFSFLDPIYTILCLLFGSYLEKVAVKIIDKTKVDAASRRLIFREMAMLDKLHHPNIIRLYEAGDKLCHLIILRKIS